SELGAGAGLYKKRKRLVSSLNGLLQKKSTCPGHSVSPADMEQKDYRYHLTFFPATSQHTISSFLKPFLPCCIIYIEEHISI
ncbi:hypothetical protein, partial [Peribacillus sp. NPDC097295]|uniref:hypothetical protein n=1 Tax=Peribacillus sp. NPDC097295 TaxID=3364402 RepID=UPI003826ED82